MRSIKKINIKNRPYYFFNDVINIKNVDSNLLNVDKKGVILKQRFIRHIKEKY